MERTSVDKARGFQGGGMGAGIKNTPKFCLKKKKVKQKF